MATASVRKLSKIERDVIIRGLDLLSASQLRAAKASPDADVISANEAAASRTANVRAVVLSAELEL